MVDEAKTKANRAKDYLVRIRGIKREKIIALDSGYRESFMVELFIADEGVDAPTPRPTVDANQVEIIPLRKTRSRKETSVKP